jgi:hypothetical protein
MSGGSDEADIRITTADPQRQLIYAVDDVTTSMSGQPRPLSESLVGQTQEAIERAAEGSDISTSMKRAVTRIPTDDPATRTMRHLAMVKTQAELNESASGCFESTKRSE